MSSLAAATATPEKYFIFLIEADSSFRIVAEGLVLPNCAIITPDGICLDVNDNIWVAALIQDLSVATPPTVMAR